MSVVLWNAGKTSYIPAGTAELVQDKSQRAHRSSILKAKYEQITDNVMSCILSARIILFYY